MWLFGGSRSPAVEDVPDEAEALKEEAEEVRLKLEALRMAEYRQAQRIACGKEAPEAAEASDGSPGPARELAARYAQISSDRAQLVLEANPGHASASSTSTGQPAAVASDSAPAEQNAKAGSPYRGDDLEDMYNFSNFVSQGSAAQPEGRQVNDSQLSVVGQHVGDSAAVVNLHPDGDEHDDEGEDEGDDSPESDATLQRLRRVEARLRQREEALEAQKAAQDKKWAAASRQLEKTRAQMRQLSEQVEAKGKDDSKFSMQADALQRLLAEKERRLETALGDAASVLEDGAEEQAAMPPSRSEKQQRQEAERAAKEEREEELVQLATMTEELTDALETARDSEETTRKQLTAAALRLQQEREQRSAFEQELSLTGQQQEQDAEIAALRSRLQRQEQVLARERARATELEAKPKQMHVDAIKKPPKVFEHIEV